MEQKNKQNRMVIALAIVGIIALSAWVFSWGFSLFSDDKSSWGNVAIIPIKGVIVSDAGNSLFDESLTSSTDTISLIDEAENDPSILAVVFEINSPGGSAVASDEIGQRIKRMKKPSVAWIREVGASGGYWVASATDHIIANRMSITGSIGVISSYLDFSGLLERYNVSYERLVSGEYKDIGSPYRRLTDKERDLLLGKLDVIKEEFVKEVASNRNLSVDSVDELASGLFYLGSEAYSQGLIDELGGKEEVKAYLKKTLNTEVEFVTFEIKRSFLERLAGVSYGGFYFMGRGIAQTFIDQGQGLKI